jgi:hypothetical protein
MAHREEDKVRRTRPACGRIRGATIRSRGTINCYPGWQHCPQSPFPLVLPITDGESGSDGRMVGDKKKTKRAGGREEIVIMSLGKEGRKERWSGSQIHSLQVWGKSGTTGTSRAHLPQPMLGLPGAGPGKGRSIVAGRQTRRRLVKWVQPDLFPSLCTVCFEGRCVRTYYPLKYDNELETQDHPPRDEQVGSSRSPDPSSTASIPAAALGGLGGMAPC